MTKAPLFRFLPEQPAVSSTIVGCDRRGNHSEGRNVLRYDGSVLFVKGEAYFQEELGEPCNAEFAKALREVEGP